MAHTDKTKLPEWWVATIDADDETNTALHGTTNDDQEALNLLAANPGSVAINKPHAKVPKAKAPKVKVPKTQK